MTDLKLPLLSPQHLTDTARDNHPIKNRTNTKADEDECTLLWQQWTRQKWVQHDPLTNMPIFQIAPGAIQYQAFEATFMACDAYLATGLVLPQYHCHSNDFFETTHHNQPNIVTSATWKQSAGLRQADSTPTTREPLENFAKPWRVPEEWPKPAWNDPKTQKNSDVFLRVQEFPHKILQRYKELDRKFCAGFWGSYSHRLGVTKCRYKLTWQAAQDVEGYGRVSIATQFLCGFQDVLHGFSELLQRSKADLFHDNHLDLQECMSNLVAFNAEMMGDIMYFRQAIKQPDA